MIIHYAKDLRQSTCYYLVSLSDIFSKNLLRIALVYQYYIVNVVKNYTLLTLWRLRIVKGTIVLVANIVVVSICLTI